MAMTVKELRKTALKLWPIPVVLMGLWTGHSLLKGSFKKVRLVEPMDVGSAQFYDTRKSYLCFKPLGRLGNHMFGYASAFSIAKAKGMELVSVNMLQQYFHLSSNCEKTIEIWGTVCKTVPTLKENSKACNAFDPKIWKENGTRSVRIEGCLRSWKYLKGHEKEIRQQFTFCHFIQTEAVRALRSAIEGHYFGGRVFVGVHVRRGDRLYSNDLPVPNKAYYLNAMGYMRAKYKTAVFVVVSEDIRWSKANLFFDDTVFVDTKRAVVDFAVLSYCNHTIMSVGTFGWWASWLANGTTIYYKKAFEVGSRAASHTIMGDYMPPDWIAME